MNTVLLVTLLRLYWPPFCIKNAPQEFLPQALCTCCFSSLEYTGHIFLRARIPSLERLSDHLCQMLSPHTVLVFLSLSNL